MENDSDHWNTYIYTDQKTILSELEKRKNDPQLKKAVEDFWGTLQPDFLSESETPKGFFARPIITPNMETRFFNDIVGDFKVEPLYMEFPDKFVTVNRAKYHLGKTHHFFTSRNGNRVIEKKRLIDFNKYEGRHISEIETIDGEKLREVHHRWFEESFPEHKDKIKDISEWFDKTRNNYDDYYYLGFLALGIYHGVIFENFMLDDEREREFFVQKVIPSFKEIERLFGMKPLISPILPVSNAKLDEWYHYPKG